VLVQQHDDAALSIEQLWMLLFPLAVCWQQKLHCKWGCHELIGACFGWFGPGNRQLLRQLQFALIMCSKSLPPAWLAAELLLVPVQQQIK
jgi:hypothetical protein